MGRMPPPTPAVFVRVENKGLRTYGTWKSIRNSGGGAEGSPPPGILYECKNKGVTKFAIRKRMKTNGAKDSTLWPLMHNPWSVEEQRISARSRERHAGGMRRTKVAGTWGRIYVRAGSPAPQE